MSDLPETMRAVRLHTADGIEALAVDDVPVPTPAAGEVLVRVHAAAITRGELDWPVDRLPAIPSYELSGRVAAVGAEVTDRALGEDVYALTGFDRDGGAAEYALVRASDLAPKPHRLAHIEAAAIPLAGLTAWQALFDHGRLQAGERVLILGATGGVGHLAVQLARRHGADVLAAPAPDQPADLVIDTAGGEPLAHVPEAMREGGRLVCVADEPPAAVSERIVSTYFVVEPSGRQLAELTGLADSGSVRPEIDSVFALDDARAAFERVGQRGKRGKVVLRVLDG